MYRGFWLSFGPMKLYKILFVCMGNICRSPAGECMMRHKVMEAGLGEKILCDSAGTIGFHAGSPPDARMREAGRWRGISVSGASRLVTREDLEYFDLILAMDRENLADLKRLDKKGRYRDKLELFCAYCRSYNERDVPDPYYGGSEGFEHVFDLLEDGCAHLLEELKAYLLVS